MREIKFRAWSKRFEKYVKPSEFMITGHGDIYNVCLGDKDETDNEPKQLILEQYVGLKDKNGKEIYEGSLVEYIEDGDSFISEVKYFGNDDYPAFDIEAPSAFYFESNVLSSGVANNCLEVVGNIHENPELLEVSE